jgi:predicted DNA-binding protein
MKDALPRYTLRVPQILLDKLGYIAEYEGRTKNKELEQLMKKRIAEFEEVHGPIDVREIRRKNSDETAD